MKYNEFLEIKIIFPAINLLLLVNSFSSLKALIKLKFS